jgi:hypothetical protein
LMGAAVFILIGLVLLVDFAHGFTEMCLEKWEDSESGNNLWKYILVGSTFGLYAFTIAITVVMYVYFAGSGCTVNRYVHMILNFISKLIPPQLLHHLQSHSLPAHNFAVHLPCRSGSQPEIRSHPSQYGCCLLRISHPQCNWKSHA